MPVVRLSFSVYQSSNENGGGGHAWQNVQGAGASAYGAGAFDVRDPNSANMNWIRSNGDGARGSATIPAGSIITGMVVGFQAYQTGGNQTGGTYDCSIFKGGSAVASKTGSIAQGGTIGPFGASNDLWGLGGVVSPTYFTDMYFGLHLNFPNITANINMYAWNGYMDIYYNDPTPVPTTISVGGGNNQSAVINTQFGLQLYAVVRDQGGNPMAGRSVTFTLPASGASAGFNSLGGPKTATGTTNASGGAVSPFFFANGTTGNWQPVADVTGSSPLVFVLFNETNNPVPPTLVPTTITKIQGDSQSTPINVAFPTVQKIKIQDQFGAVMNNVEINWTVPGSGARGTYAGGTPAISYTGLDGVATAPVLTANATVGAWTQNTFPTGFAGVNAAFSFTNIANNLPPTPTFLQVSSGSNQAAVLSTNFGTQVNILVLDQYGSPYIGGASVTATIPSSANGKFLSNNLQTRTVTSDGTGIAAFGTIVAGASVSAGWNMTVTCTGTGGTTVGAFRNVDPAIVTTITAISGMTQSAPASTSFAAALVARATNGIGAPLQNVSVTFTAPGTAASCRFAGSATQVVLTDVNGNATSAVPVATATDGTYTVVASATGATSANFPLTNGAAYDPEVCTPMEAPPSGCINTTTQGGTLAWTNPQRASDAAAGGTFAACPTTQATGASNYMYSTPPASWLAVPGTAKVTSISCSFWERNPTGANRGPTSFRVLINNVLRGTQKSTATLNTAFTNYTGTWTAADLGALVTMADMVATLSGVAIRAGVQSGQDGTNQINGLTVSICYQTVSPPPVRPELPLVYCPM